MDKYTLLVLLNAPFVIFGIIKAMYMYKDGIIQRIGFMLRIFFWLGIFSALLFAENIYSFLFSNNLTNTTPLSLADVVLVTGVMFSLTLCVRLYAKMDTLEKRVSDLHEELSISMSSKK